MWFLKIHKIKTNFALQRKILRKKSHDNKQPKVLLPALTHRRFFNYWNIKIQENFRFLKNNYVKDGIRKLTISSLKPHFCILVLLLAFNISASSYQNQYYQYDTSSISRLYKSTTSISMVVRSITSECIIFIFIFGEKKVIRFF